MMHTWKYRRSISILFMSIFFLITVVFFSSYIPLQKDKANIDKLATLMTLLYFEKQNGNEYPNEIECFKDNEFDEEDVLTDFWGNPFYYEQLSDGKDFLLVSKGKDGILFTEDDICSDDIKPRYRFRTW